MPEWANRKGLNIVTKAVETDSGAKAMSSRPDTSKDAVRTHVITLMESIPFGDDDGYGMVQSILDADNWEDFASDSSKLPKAAEVSNRKLKVRELTRRESTIENGDDSGLDLPWYLVIDSTDIETGDRVLWQTSAATVVAKLIRLYEMNKLPAVVETRLSDKTTKRGFRPVNLSVHSVTP